MVCNNKDWNAPLLITGCARTGTSALARCLSTHPELCIFNEYHLYYKKKDTFYLWSYLSQMSENNPPPEKVDENTATLKDRLLRELPEPATNEATRDWLFRSMPQSTLVYGDKLPYEYLGRMRLIAKEHPGVKYLVTLRDGRDVIASQIRNHKLAAKKGGLPSHWMRPSVREAEFLWLRSARTWLKLRSNPPAPCLEVRYEQATLSPEALARNICEFLGIVYRKNDFRQFFSGYKPVRIRSWHEEIENIEEQLSSDFIDMLRKLDYS